MKAWWDGLNQRERSLVVITALLLGLALLWMLAVKPFIGHYRLLEQDLADAKAIHQQMQQQRPEILQLRGGNSNRQPANQNSSLHSLVDQTLKQFQLDEDTDSQGRGKDSATLKIKDKSFDTLAKFLSQMDTRYAARATRMTVKPADTAGAVDAEITLER